VVNVDIRWVIKKTRLLGQVSQSAVLWELLRLQANLVKTGHRILSRAV